MCFVIYCKIIWGEDPCETVKNGTGFGAFLLVGVSERALLLVETDLQKECEMTQTQLFNVTMWKMFERWLVEHIEWHLSSNVST